MWRGLTSTGGEWSGVPGPGNHIIFPLLTQDTGCLSRVKDVDQSSRASFLPQPLSDGGGGRGAKLGVGMGSSTETTRDLSKPTQISVQSRISPLLRLWWGWLLWWRWVKIQESKFLKSFLFSCLSWQKVNVCSILQNDILLPLTNVCHNDHTTLNLSRL